MKEYIKKLLCRVGIHRPLAGHRTSFVDSVSGKSVFVALCPCGKKWMVDSPFGMFGFKVQMENHNEK